MSLSFILSNQSNIFSFKKTIFSEIFSSKNVEKIARDCGAMIRSRKLKINKYIISALSVLSNSPNVIDLYAIKAKSIAVSECIGANQAFDNEMLSSFGPIPTDFLPISICSISIDIKEL